LGVDNSLSLLTDADIILGELDSTLFPGVPSSVRVHEGFRDEHVKTATLVLAEVNKLLMRTGSNSVTCVCISELHFLSAHHSLLQVGHSLGGALAQLDSLFFSLNLNPSVSIKAVTFGIPRVGNPDYAAFFDSKVCFCLNISSARQYH
jgi:predicted lipase